MPRRARKNSRPRRKRNPNSVGDVILFATHPHVYAAKKGIEWGLDIYDRYFRN
jgi:hypothetical protein